MKRFLFFKHPHSPESKEIISGNHIIGVNILSVVRCFLLNVWVQFIRYLWKIWEKTRTINIVVFKILHLSCRYIQEFFTSAKKREVLKLSNKLFTLCDHQLAMVMLELKNTLMNIPNRVTIKTITKKFKNDQCNNCCRYYCLSVLR